MDRIRNVFHGFSGTRPAAESNGDQPAATPPSSAAPKPSRSLPASSSATVNKPLPRSPKKPATTNPSLASRNNVAHNRAPTSKPYLNQPNTPNESVARHRRSPSQSLSFLPTISLRRSQVNSNHATTERVNGNGPRSPPDPYAGIASTDYATGEPEKAGLWNKAQRSWKSKTTRGHATHGENPRDIPVGYDYDHRMVDVLDTIDPEVQTLTSLTNVQNSLFVPDLGRYVNRRPTYSLSEIMKDKAHRSQDKLQEVKEAVASPNVARPAPARRKQSVTSIDSTLSDSRYAVLPHDIILDGWSKEDLSELNDHVRHMLHSRRSKFKRAMKGFGQYIRRPLGFLVTLYATLITLFGLAWVLFLIGWINVGGRQTYIINVIDNVLVALFAIVGDGLAPFRAVDTYRMIYIARYHNLTKRIRKERAMPELQDHNDLPLQMPPPIQVRATKRSVNMLKNFSKKMRFRRRKLEPDVEEPPQEYSVLNAKQQQRLLHHQEKFAKSHTFYKPHETETHYAFPWRLLVAIVILLDFHSAFQIALGACTWGISYHVRPFVLTTVILCCSITCNATAGVLIMIGDRRTRKNDVLERMNRQELTQAAIEKMQKKWEKEEQEGSPRY